MRNILASSSRRFWSIAGSFAIVFLSGCVELVHFGQISDRESSWAVVGVRVEQQQPDGGWKHIGDSDGKGRYSIFRDSVKGGGNVRLSKTGYSPVIMPEADFLQQNNILMSPTGGSEDFGRGMGR